MCGLTSAVRRLVLFAGQTDCKRCMVSMRWMRLPNRCAPGYFLILCHFVSHSYLTHRIRPCCKAVVKNVLIKCFICCCRRVSLWLPIYDKVSRRFLCAADLLCSLRYHSKAPVTDSRPGSNPKHIYNILTAVPP